MVVRSLRPWYQRLGRLVVESGSLEMQSNVQKGMSKHGQFHLVVEARNIMFGLKSTVGLAGRTLCGWVSCEPSRFMRVCSIKCGRWWSSVSSNNL